MNDDNIFSAYDEPEMQRLCTEQIRELSALTAKHAAARIRLALVLRANDVDGYDVQPAHDRYDR